MMILHAPLLVNYEDTFRSEIVSSLGNVSYPVDKSSPFSRSLKFDAAAGNVIYHPKMYRTTKMSIAFWYKCGGLNSGASGSFTSIVVLATQSANTSANFRLERISLTDNTYSWFNNGNATTSGGCARCTIPDNTWVHIAVSFDIEANKYESWTTPINGTTTHTSGNMGVVTPCYFTDLFQINKTAHYSSAEYSDIRIYNSLLSEYEVREILKRPLLHYSFNNPAGDALTAVYDLTGMGNNSVGLIGDSLPTVEESKLGCTCASFTGGQGITLPDACKVEGDFSASWWYYRTDTYGNSSILTSNQCSIGCGPSAGKGYRVYTRDGTNLYFQDIDAQGTVTNKYCGFAVNNLPVNQWHLFTFAFDFRSKNVKLYVDGVLKSTVSFTRDSMTYDATALEIGSYKSGERLKANIDDFKIYASVLTLEDIQQEYSRRLNINNQYRWNCNFIDTNSESTFSIINEKSLSRPTLISELGRPTRYIRISSNGSNKNGGNHIIQAAVETVDKGKIMLLDAINSPDDQMKAVSGLMSCHTESAPYYWDVGGVEVFDLGELDFVASVFLKRIYADGRYYYQTKIEGSINNQDWFVIWDSHNSGSYGEDSLYNVYIEEEKGKTFPVPVDKVYINVNGMLISNRFSEE